MAWATAKRVGECRFAPTGLLAALAIFACTSDLGTNGVLEAQPDAELVAQFKKEAVLWIRAERERYRPLALALSEPERRMLAAYFSDETLDRARVLVVDGFENPEFFALFEKHGEPYPVDLTRASGLALVDTILLARTASQNARRGRVLFHELVHLEQYEVLGLEAYMESYVDSWAENGRDYRAIPHEAQAFELASRFGAGGAPFSVEAEVRSIFAATVGVSTAPD